MNIKYLNKFLVVLSNRLSGSVGFFGKLALATTSSYLAFLLGTPLFWAVVFFFAVYLARSTPTRWVWELAHPEAFIGKPKLSNEEVHKQIGLMVVTGFLMKLCLVGFAPMVVLGLLWPLSWILGAYIYRIFGKRFGFELASKINPAEITSGIGLLSIIIIGTLN